MRRSTGRRPWMIGRGLGALLLATTGCSTVRPWTQDVTIQTVPAGVPVTVDGQDRGPAPVTLRLKRNQGHTVVAALPGSVYRRDLSPRFSTTGKLDMIGGALLLVPGIGVLFPGAFDLDDHVVLNLDQPPSAATQPATSPAR